LIGIRVIKALSSGRRLFSEEAVLVLNAEGLVRSNLQMLTMMGDSLTGSKFRLNRFSDREVRNVFSYNPLNLLKASGTETDCSYGCVQQNPQLC
jgi:hypothetical protein